MQRVQGCLGAAAVVLLAVACRGPAAEADGPDVFRQTIGEGFELSVSEELRLDAAAENTGFHLVRSVAMDERGDVYVLDAGNHRVAVYDAAGRLVRQFGQEGKGPGDLERPGSMWLARDTVAISDTNNRLHFFRLDGTHLLTRAYLDLMTGRDLWIISGVVGTPSGWLLSGSAYFRNAAESDTSQPPLLRLTLFDVVAGGDLEPAGFHFEREEEGAWSGIYWITAPYAPRVAGTVDGLGRMHLATSADYAINVYDADGTLLRRVENEVRRVPVEGEMLDRWESERPGCEPGIPCDAAQHTRLALSLPRGEYVPPIALIRGFVGGYTAVRRSFTDPDLTDEVEYADHDFFDPDGRYLGTLGPPGIPRWFDGSTLLVTEYDELRGTSVVKYRVETVGPDR